MKEIISKELRIPHLLSPAAKDYLWGGSRINEVFGKNIRLAPLAETWECSAHPDGPSRFCGGPLDGMPFDEALAAYPFLWTDRKDASPRGDFPLLVKLIDAKGSLSVQVHPDDLSARQLEGEARGKTEVWVVLEADEGASVVYGFCRPVTPREVTAAAKDGTLETLLRRVPVKAGDVIPIPAGTVHAIGAGILLAEIQESSNLTYRLYDWGRVGADGKPRQLHLEKAEKVMRCDSSVPFFGGFREKKQGTVILCENDWFVLSRTVGTEAVIPACASGFSVLLCVGGEGRCGALSFRAGDCIFLPLGCPETRLCGNFEILCAKENRS